MAATFVNTQTQQAVRVLAKDDARALAPLYVRDTTNPTEAQKQAYRIMPEEVLFSVKPVTLKIPAQEMPGYRGSRIQCPECGEGVNFHREIQRDGRTLCIPCAQGGFLPSDNDVEKTDGKPQIVLVIGYKKVGKTTLIERLIPELSNRGYRVGTVKHHHADFPVSVDTAGTDTWRHRQAGAASVALATPTDIAVFRDAESSISLDQIVSMLGALDIVLVEGFHEEPHAKIEVLTDHVNEPLCKSDQDLLALVAPRGTKSTVPTFSSSDITALADLIQDRILHRH